MPEEKKEPTFTCALCNREIDKRFMGRWQDVCEMCEGQCDDAPKGESFE